MHSFNFRQKYNHRKNTINGQARETSHANAFSGLYNPHTFLWHREPICPPPQKVTRQIRTGVSCVMWTTHEDDDTHDDVHDVGRTRYVVSV